MRSSFDSDDTQLTPLTPLASRDNIDEYAISSDSDINSFTSLTSVNKIRRESFGRKKTSRQDVTASKIYRNLLILESSLISQYEIQQKLRRKYNFFLGFLTVIGGILVRELVNASNGIYKNIMKMVLISILITFVLFNLSGEYKRTIVLPRRFLSMTNKGLRQINVKLVKVKSPISEVLTDYLRSWLNFQIFFAQKLINHLQINKFYNFDKIINRWKFTTQPRINNQLKLVLNPRYFSTNLREGWELYRNEFWIQEGLRRKQFNIDKRKVDKKRKKRRRTLDEKTKLGIVEED